VRCLVGDLIQVFLNRIVNAAHAIGERKRTSRDLRGRIRVTSAVDGGAVVVSVSDTVAGIPEKIRDRIFDPFFTTKEVGRGTGQGLAISRSIAVEKHSGDLTLETVVGEDTTFHVRLPIDGPEHLKAAA
jgi:signal transduction histidine kinase